MAKKCPRLVKIENDRIVLNEMDREFLYNLQNSLLLALKDEGVINAVQYEYAAELLKRQFYEQTVKE